MESLISDSQKLKPINNIVLIDFYGTTTSVSFLLELYEYIKQYGFGVSDLGSSKDCDKLYLNFMLENIFKMLRADTKKKAFYVGKKIEFRPWQNDTTKKALNILLNYLKFPSFDPGIPFQEFLWEIQSNDVLKQELDVFTEKVKNTQRYPSLPKLKAVLKKEGLDFLATQYFNDYNAKLLLTL